MESDLDAQKCALLHYDFYLSLKMEMHLFSPYSVIMEEMVIN